MTCLSYIWSFYSALSYFIIDTECCSAVNLKTTGISHFTHTLGTYNLQDTYQDRPIYKHETWDEYLFYVPPIDERTVGLWMIGPDTRYSRGSFHIRSYHVCPEDVQNEWEFSDGVNWKIDSELRLVCAEPESGITYVNTSK